MVFVNFNLEEYQGRLRQIASWEPQIVNLVERLPTHWISSVNNLNTVYFIIAQITVVGVILSKKATSNFVFNFQNNNLELISLPVRFIFEIWASICFTRTLLIELIENFNEEHFGVLIDQFEDEQLRRTLESGNNDDNLANQLSTTQNRLVLLRRYFRLTRGSRINLEYPWGGGNTEFSSINVLNMIDLLNGICPNARDMYDFLCESCHPNYLQLANWTQLSLPRDLLEQTFHALEIALDGISTEAIDIISRVIQEIER